MSSPRIVPESPRYTDAVNIAAQRKKAAEFYALGVKAISSSNEHGNEKSHNYFLQSIQSITRGIARDKWLAEDYLKIMESYRNLILGETKSKSNEDIDAAQNWVQISMKFYNDFTVHEQVSYPYYYSACEINLSFVQHYLQRFAKSTYLLKYKRPELKKYLENAVEILQKAQTFPCNTPSKEGVLRKLSKYYFDIATAYAQLGDHENKLKYAMAAVSMRLDVANDRMSTIDFINAAVLFQQMGSKLFRSVSPYVMLFGLMSSLLSGRDLMNLQDVEHLFNRYLEKTDGDIEKLGTLEAVIKLMTECKRNARLPDSELKFALQSEKGALLLKTFAARVNDKLTACMDNECDVDTLLLESVCDTILQILPEPAKKDTVAVVETAGASVSELNMFSEKRRTERRVDAIAEGIQLRANACGFRGH